jgi:site-specific DNA-adenine methylase
MINGQIRFLTHLENQRIHGFRDEFEFVGTKTQINKQLGNTVSPGVYSRLFGSIFQSIDLDISIQDTPPVKKSKRARKPKKTIIVNNHINVVKKITNIPDENYLNLTQSKLNEYKNHLENGGTISVTIEKYKTNKDKQNDILECKYIISIQDLIQLGFRDKKNGIYRVKIIGSKDKLDKVGQRDVLIVRQGGKGKFKQQINQAIIDMGLKENKVDTVIDSFFGGGGLTLSHIDNLKFNKYIINDLEPLIYKTMLAVKKDYKKVMKVYQEVNEHYYDLVPEELKNFKKDTSCRIDKNLQQLRDKDRSYRDFYREIGNRLNNKELDIYSIAGYFIFFNNRSASGVLTFTKEGLVDTKNCDNGTTLKDKSHMIKHWSYLLNKHNVEILNKDVFEVLENIPTNSLVLSDSPYIPKSKDKSVNDYGMDNSEQFQHQLKETLDRFDNLLYFNEDCDYLYDLGLDKGFDKTVTFPRNNRLGHKNDGGFEFMGFKSVFMTSSIQSIINSDYHPSNLQLVA